MWHKSSHYHYLRIQPRFWCFLIEMTTWIGPAYAMAVRSIITSGKSTTCGTRSVIDWTLGLVEHDSTSHVVDEGRETDWIISCSMGQAIYPKVFENRNICQPGYLVLYWAPGLLFFNGEKYDRGIGASEIMGKESQMWMKHYNVIVR